MTSRQDNILLSLPSDRVLGCLLGGILGMLLSCCLAVALLLLPGDDVPISGSSPPAEYDIEAIIEEDYVNRTFLESAASLPQPVPLTGGSLDVHPGGRAVFAVQSEIGPLHPVFEGSVVLRATEAGELEVVLSEVRVGRLPVTMFVPDHLLDDVNRDVNRQLKERTGSTDVRLVAVTSDETTLHFFLVSVP